MGTHRIQQQYDHFQDILSNKDLETLFEKYHVHDDRERKLPVRRFFWLMVFSALEPSTRGSLLVLIGFYLGSIAALFEPGRVIVTLSKAALSTRLSHVSWYLFRGVYLHLLEKYRAMMPADELRFLDRFTDAFAVDGSIISLCKRVEALFKSVHKGQASLKLNAKLSLTLQVVTKLQVSMGKRHDSRFNFVTSAAGVLYLCDLGYWSFRLFQKIIDAGSFFVSRLKRSCDPLICHVTSADLQQAVGKRLSEIQDLLQGRDTLDVTVQLSSAKNPRFTEKVRLLGLLHETQWHFYVTNIVETRFTPALCYKLYALRWQVELYFDVLKNFLNLHHVISRTKNGIMIEIYSALILHLFTRIIIALAAQQEHRSIHDYSFQRSFKLIKGLLLAHLPQVFQRGVQVFYDLFAMLINVVMAMGRSQRPNHIRQVMNDFSP